MTSHSNVYCRKHILKKWIHNCLTEINRWHFATLLVFSPGTVTPTCITDHSPWTAAEGVCLSSAQQSHVRLRGDSCHTAVSKPITTVIAQRNHTLLLLRVSLLKQHAHFFKKQSQTQHSPLSPTPIRQSRVVQTASHWCSHLKRGPDPALRLRLGSCHS